MRKPSTYDRESDPQYDADSEDVDYDGQFYTGAIAPKTRKDTFDDYSLYSYK